MPDTNKSLMMKAFENGNRASVSVANSRLTTEEIATLDQAGLISQMCGILSVTSAGKKELGKNTADTEVPEHFQ